MRGNAIRVVVRPRPTVAWEGRDAWRIEGNTLFELDPATGDPRPQGGFTYERVCRKDATTKEIYDEHVDGMVDSAVRGYNSTIFAYGQSSSGKSYTMFGLDFTKQTQQTLDSLPSPGVIPLAIQSMFDKIAKTPKRVYTVRVSYLEIYNDQLRDLLVQDASARPPEVRSTSEGVWVSGAFEPVVKTLGDVLRYVHAGDARREVGATSLNERSSRSHAVIRILIESCEPEDVAEPGVAGEGDEPGGIGGAEATADAAGSAARAASAGSTGVSSVARTSRPGLGPHRASTGQISVTRSSILTLVDLAGSERQSKTQATGKRFAEGCKINSSLMILGKVINALICGEAYVNFRDCLLTMLLKPSLGGNSITLIIACVTPAAEHVDETKNTLLFAQRASRVVNKATINESAAGGSAAQRAQLEIRRLKARIAELEAELQALRAEAPVGPPGQRSAAPRGAVSGQPGPASRQGRPRALRTPSDSFDVSGGSDAVQEPVVKRASSGGAPFPGRAPGSQRGAARSTDASLIAESADTADAADIAASAGLPEAPCGAGPRASQGRASNIPMFGTRGKRRESVMPPPLGGSRPGRLGRPEHQGSHLPQASAGAHPVHAAYAAHGNHVAHASQIPQVSPAAQSSLLPPTHGPVPQPASESTDSYFHRVETCDAGAQTDPPPEPALLVSAGAGSGVFQALEASIGVGSSPARSLLGSTRVTLASLASLVLARSASVQASLGGLGGEGEAVAADAAVGASVGASVGGAVTPTGPVDPAADLAPKLAPALTASPPLELRAVEGSVRDAACDEPAALQLRDLEVVSFPLARSLSLQTSQVERSYVPLGGALEEKLRELVKRLQEGLEGSSAAVGAGADPGLSLPGQPSPKDYADQALKLHDRLMQGFHDAAVSCVGREQMVAEDLYVREAQLVRSRSALEALVRAGAELERRCATSETEAGTLALELAEKAQACDAALEELRASAQELERVRSESVAASEHRAAVEQLELARSDLQRVQQLLAGSEESCRALGAAVEEADQRCREARLEAEKEREARAHLREQYDALFQTSKEKISQVIARAREREAHAAAAARERILKLERYKRVVLQMMGQAGAPAAPSLSDPASQADFAAPAASVAAVAPAAPPAPQSTPTANSAAAVVDPGSAGSLGGLPALGDLANLGDMGSIGGIPSLTELGALGGIAGAPAPAADEIDELVDHVLEQR